MRRLLVTADARTNENLTNLWEAVQRLEGANLMTVTAPGPMPVGAGIIVGQLFGVALREGGAGDRVPCQIGGVVTLPKQAGASWSGAGQVVKWDAAAGAVGYTGDLSIGLTVGAVVGDAPTVDVLLLPSIVLPAVTEAAAPARP